MYGHYLRHIDEEGIAVLSLCDPRSMYIHFDGFVRVVFVNTVILLWLWQSLATQSSYEAVDQEFGESSRRGEDRSGAQQTMPIVHSLEYYKAEERRTSQWLQIFCKFEIPSKFLSA